MKLYNHVAYKLGQHEKEVASYIPEGGGIGKIFLWRLPIKG